MASKKENTVNKLPGVLSFQRCLLITDALFFNEFADGTLTPLPVIRHGIRGVQNISKKSKKGQEAASSASREEVTNIQTTDSAKLDAKAERLLVRFDLRSLDLSNALFACAPGNTDEKGKNKESSKRMSLFAETAEEEKSDDRELVKTIRESIHSFIQRAKEGKADESPLFKLACHYAHNIANGRFLWRNRMIARDVQIEVQRLDQHGHALAPQGDTPAQWTFDALQRPLTSFNDMLAQSARQEEAGAGDFESIPFDEQEVAAVLAAGWQGEESAGLRVTAHVHFGVQGAVEVYPSQNYLERKERGFARSLYCIGDAPEGQDAHSIRVMGQAALRDQKIGNALRTIDVWYPDYNKRRLPLPVEPNGASLEAQEFFRKGEDSGFILMRRIGGLNPATPDGLFLLACLIRGGVFSEGGDKA